MYGLLSVLVPAVLLAGNFPVKPTRLADQKLPFPTRVGTKWVYQYGKEDVEEEVTEVEANADGSQLVTVRVPGIVEKGRRVVYHVTPRRLSIVELYGQRCDPPLCLLKLPVDKGERWDLRHKFWEKTLVSEGEESVRVPAGKFECVRVVEEWQRVPERLDRSVKWYAVGVGLVKSKASEGAPFADKVLQSFKSVE
jgi:hypothetical protein